jgi:hypothetical protein
METRNLPTELLTEPIVEQTMTPAQFSEALSLMLVSTLERRYLADFNANDWRIETRAGDVARPLLREVLGLGRQKRGDEWARAMPHVLTACHDPGHSLVMMLHGKGNCQSFYLGGRRIIGKAARSTQDYLTSQESAFKAYFSGLKLGAVAALDGDAYPELNELIQTAPAMTLLTGIPSGRGGSLPVEFQSLDRLATAIGPQKYALMVVAEPLEPQLIDQTLDACLRLKSEVHSYVRLTRAKSHGTSKSESSTESKEESNLTSELPLLLIGLAVFCQTARFIPGLNILGSLSGVLQSGSMLAMQQNNRLGRGTSRQINSGESWSESGSTELLNAHAEACEQLLQQHIQRLQAARSFGWWQTAVYVVAEQESTLHNITGAWRSICSGDATSLDPIRSIALPDYVLREAIRHGSLLNLHPTQSEQGHPLGESFDSLSTCLNSDELAVILNLPQQELPGLPMREQSAFALTVPPPTPDSIVLGELQDAQGRDVGSVTIPATTLNRHVFVTGMSGYGKTNTCMQILLEAYNKLGVPFLVIEPAKAEYRNLAQIAEISGRLRVYTVGGNSPLPFRLNPFSPVPGIPLGRHIDLLKAVFNASFPMFAGMAYILEEAILEVYEERGWSIYDSQNDYLAKRSSLNERSALIPSLQDLHDKIDLVLARKKYGQEINQNMGAALRSRLRSLMVGNKGLTLNTRRSTPIQDILGNPTIIELQNLGDDEEKAFVMALLFVFLYEYGEARQQGLSEANREKLQHLTLIEEAHRLLQGQRNPSSGEIGDPRAKAVAMFTDMLAEMRAYGEGFIIADQIPTKLAPETLKNTNLKILHRLSAPDDRQVAGSCINLTESQTKYLNNLSPGLAVLHDERIGEAVLTRIESIKEVHLQNLSEVELQNLIGKMPAADKIYLFRHAGCSACPSPCDFYHKVEGSRKQQDVARALQPFFENFYLNSCTSAWSSWSKWKTQSMLPSSQQSNRNFATGISYCAATQCAYKWLIDLAQARNQSTNPDSELNPGDRLTIEKAAKAIGELLIVWVTKEALDEEAESVFNSTHQQFLELMTKEPPRELQGCQTCPARCHIWRFVAPHQATMATQISRSLLSNQTADEYLLLLERTVAPVLQNTPLIANNTNNLRRNWIYCLLTNLDLPPATTTKRDELLEMIRLS